ncbi:MAG: glycosyltransferase family 1 protein [Acidocella sp.]|nr:glycosyltransferase family 1 protein [Acidocella sp.]
MRVRSRSDTLQAFSGLQRILIVTDAWAPQVNGVVRTLRTITHEIQGMGKTVEIIGPDRFNTVPMPSYPEIRLAILPARKLARLIEAFAPDALHIATEGPLGMAARRYAIRNGFTFTTAFHTRFAEYLRARTGMPLRLTYSWLRWFHGAGAGMMVATQSLRDEMAVRGFRNIRAWSRGVDLQAFAPEPAEDWQLPRPIFVYVGRVAVEKNLRAFLDLSLPGSKLVVGDGPQRKSLERAYPDAHFAGARHGAALASAYAGADVFVFPSRTDTFGLVVLEALASGLPVAAYPVTGPLDILGAAPAPVGALDADLRQAALAALTIDRSACRPYAESYSWTACAQRFMDNLVPMQGFRTFSDQSETL